jgi:hypothetical protein
MQEPNICQYYTYQMEASYGEYDRVKVDCNQVGKAAMYCGSRLSNDW